MSTLYCRERHWPPMIIMLLALADCTGALPRVFVFPIYSTAASRAFFGTGEHNASREGRQTPTYKLTVDGRGTATFPETQFIEMDLQPGTHSLEVQEYGWLGTSLRKVTGPVSIGGPGQILFIAIPASASDMTLEVVDADYGMKQIAGREKAATNQN